MCKDLVRTHKKLWQSRQNTALHKYVSDKRKKASKKDLEYWSHSLFIRVHDALLSTRSRMMLPGLSPEHVMTAHLTAMAMDNSERMDG